MHLASVPEVLIYAGLLSAGVAWGVRAPTRWKDRAAAALVVLILAASGLGVLDAFGLLTP